MAHKKGQGSSRNGRDSNSQRLGVKAFGGELISAGSIIIRQRGARFRRWPVRRFSDNRIRGLVCFLTGVIHAISFSVS